MIELYPIEKETIVASHDWEAIIEKLSVLVNQPVSRGATQPLLKGWVKDDEFEVTIRLRRQQPFMPLVYGMIDPTSKGCILFLTYKLFPATKFLLTFWTIIVPLVGAPLAYEYRNIWIAAGFLTFLVFIHLVARANFRLHVKTTQKILHRVFYENTVV